MKSKFIGALAIVLFIGGCSPSSNENINDELGREVASADSGKVQVPDEMIDEMIHSIPSPIELSSVILNSGAEYYNGIINPSSNYKNYFDDYSKALNLGIYGLDLGYMNLYEKNFAVLDYIGAINTLANDLKVGQFFDFNLLKRLSSSNENMDSLVEISTSAFLDMSTYLRQNKRGSVSVMILTGSWIEGLHLAAQIASNTSNKELRERVGEQKIVLDNLIILLSVYKSDNKIKDLLADLEKLKEEYKKVSITTIYNEPTTKEIDGMLVVEDNSSNVIEIKDEQFRNITTIIGDIRSKIIS